MLRKTFVPARILLAVLLVALLTGCAGRSFDYEPVFWPPLPDDPRIQFLTSINGSEDIGKQESKFSLLVTGKTEQQRDVSIFKPYGVTVHKGKIYVSDLAGRIAVIDLDREQFEFLDGKRLVGLKKPIGVAFDNEDNLYVADTSREEILVYRSDGRFIQAIGKAPNFKVADVVVDGDRVYALDMGTSTIRVFDRKNGREVRSIGNAQGEALLAMPTGFSMKKGIFGVTNIATANVVKVDRDGNYLTSFGKLGDGVADFTRPKGVAVDDERRVYVVDNGMQCVKIFNAENRLLLVFGNPRLPRGSMNLPIGVAVTKETIPYFQKYADPDFKIEYIIFVTNQIGNSKLSVYALGQLQKS
jgi:DNA-binding beta-propeller fold protein YncE